MRRWQDWYVVLCCLTTSCFCLYSFCCPSVLQEKLAAECVGIIPVKERTEEQKKAVPKLRLMHVKKAEVDYAIKCLKRRNGENVESDNEEDEKDEAGVSGLAAQMEEMKVNVKCRVTGKSRVSGDN